MALETTLVLVKPDGMRRRLAGEIVARLERRGLELRGARLLKIPRALAQQHYAEHKGKPFFGDLATELSENVIHGSDSKQSAKRELALFFPDGLV
jgi:nucleoside-diphosphate kinase